jgi:hypothetical protein
MLQAAKKLITSATHCRSNPAAGESLSARREHDQAADRELDGERVPGKGAGSEQAVLHVSCLIKSTASFD